MISIKWSAASSQRAIPSRREEGAALARRAPVDLRVNLAQGGAPTGAVSTRTLRRRERPVVTACRAQCRSRRRTRASSTRRAPSTAWPQFAQRIKDQAQVFEMGFQLAKAGGTIPCITRSVLPDESAERVAAFVSHHKEMRIVPYKEHWERVIGGEAPASADGSTAVTPAKAGVQLWALAGAEGKRDPGVRRDDGKEGGLHHLPRQKPCHGAEGFVAYVVLDAFGIDARGFLGDAQCQQEGLDDLVLPPAVLGHFPALAGEED